MSGGAKPPTSTTTTNQLYSPEEAAQRAKVMAEASRIYSTTNPANVQGPASSADTLASQQMRRNLAANNPLAGMAPLLQQGMQFGMSDVLDPTNSPGFQATLGTATRKVDEAYTGPSGPFAQIRSGFTANNSGGSGTREGIAMGMAGRDYLNTIGDVTGKLTSDAYTKGLDVFSRTMAMAPQTGQAIMGAEGTPASLLGGIGAETEEMQGQQRAWDVNAPWASFAPYASTVMGGTQGGQQTTTTGSAPTKNPMAPIGSAMMGASIGSMVPGIGTGVGAAAGLLLGLFA